MQQTIFYETLMVKTGAEQKSLNQLTFIDRNPETMLPSLEPCAEADSRSNPSLRSTGGRGLSTSLEDPTSNQYKFLTI